MAIDPNDDTERRRQLRMTALAVAGAGTLFWLYTFYYIAQLPAGDGSGMQWMAEGPLTFIFVLFILPALVFARGGEKLKTALVLALIGVTGFALLWLELLSEFHHT